MDPLIAILLFCGVIAVTALLFSGWAVYGIFRAIASGIRSLILPTPQQRRPVIAAHDSGRARCPRARCRADNPAGARFCRRCGVSLSGDGMGASMPVSMPQRRQVFAKPVPARPAKRVAS